MRAPRAVHCDAGCGGHTFARIVGTMGMYDEPEGCHS